MNLRDIIIKFKSSNWFGQVLWWLLMNEFLLILYIRVFRNACSNYSILFPDIRILSISKHDSVWHFLWKLTHIIFNIFWQCRLSILKLISQPLLIILGYCSSILRFIISIRNILNLIIHWKIYSISILLPNILLPWDFFYNNWIIKLIRCLHCWSAIHF